MKIEYVKLYNINKKNGGKKGGGGGGVVCAEATNYKSIGLILTFLQHHSEIVGVN